MTRVYNPTPGPWQVNSGMVETASGIPIAHMDREPGNGTVPVERDANAYLIASAPTLLYALKRALAVISEHYPEDEQCCARDIETIKTAIASAEYR